ncbi:hypothetical protein [Streptomyces sp. NBC_00280]|uniref:hypothetical protein n=1 Tax=Streptomyces sp. NBC_00280 TaxID=2975699 RepID=UPI003251672D
MRVGRDQGEAFVAEVAGDLAAQRGGGQAVGGGAWGVDEFGVGVGPDVGDGVEQWRDLAGAVGADHEVCAGTG